MKSSREKFVGTTKFIVFAEKVDCQHGTYAESPVALVYIQKYVDLYKNVCITYM